MRQVVYFGLDAHVRNSALAAVGMDGNFFMSEQLRTRDVSIVSRIVAVDAKEKILALEESTLAAWLAGMLRGYVDKLVVCDPRHNALISKSANKDDLADAFRLARLLRMGELRPVYHSDHQHRATFKAIAQQYLKLRDSQRSLKTIIKAKYRRAGVLRVDGTTVFSAAHRKSFLEQLPNAPTREMVSDDYDVLDSTIAAQQKAQDRMIREGRRYPEIQQFMKMPGVGPISAHVFDAFIQTPHRFATKQRLWRYCRLGIRTRSSAGKPLAYKRLDRSGNGELKALSYRAWMNGIRGGKDSNEVKRFFEASLDRTNNRTHARLNTQRKILAVLWTIWRKQTAYDPNLFFPLTPTAQAVC